MDRQLIGEEDAFLWLSKGDLTAETGSEIVAAQDRALQTKYYTAKILNTERQIASADFANNLTRQYIT